MQNRYRGNIKTSMIDSNNKPDNQVGLLTLTNDKLSFNQYNLEKYINHIQSYGLETTWAHILNYTQINGCDDFLNPKYFGDLYEAGLAEIDKNKKKKSGQYYTPLDVSNLMSEWLKKLEGVNICDVGCGTGNLIISYLELLDKEEVLFLLKNKQIFLYDFDRVAITIAQFSIALTYGIEFLDNINVIYGDFLDKGIQLPDNSKIITNPPYAKYTEVSDNWINSEIQNEAKELYAAFMEKILITGNPAVLITPYSFLGGNKFQSLRIKLSEYNGFIVAFDNVPGNIFNGKKHGIFNTNTANSVRAAITIVENKKDIKGFRITPLIRFKNEERAELLKTSILESELSSKHQIINHESKMFEKINIELEDCFNCWLNKSDETIADFTKNKDKHYSIYMPNTCRYFTTASKKKLVRGGYITLHVDDKDKFNFLYCLINSSFIYWWWRIYDGGITYPVTLLNSAPIFYKLLSSKDKEDLSEIVDEMVSNEDKFTVTKKNAGNIQENIKFPKKYRNKINEKFLEILKCEVTYDDFNRLHKNSFFGDL